MFSPDYSVSVTTAEEAASATGVGNIPTEVGINMQLSTGAQTLMGDVAGGNPSAVPGSVGGAVQIYTGSAATAAGDSEFAGSVENNGVVSWEAFMNDAAAFLAPLGMRDPHNGQPYVHE